jgi:hypothetical protein
MNPNSSLHHPNRRDFLRSASVAAGGMTLAGSFAGALRADEPQNGPAKKLKVAAVITEFTYRSHAHVILENFLKPYLFNGQITDPGCEVVGLYVDQFPAGDMSRQVAKDYKFTIYPTIAGALCSGGKQLAVDAVLSIGEHGNYPVNAKGQREYPRKRFFDEIVAVFRSSGRAVPVYNDKHLSYRWDWAKEMYDTAKELKFGLMAGSSVPLAERRPPLELPADAPIVEALSIHGGGVESYDFHGLEVLQSMVEARRGGETGVARVRFLAGEPLWKAADDGQWSPQLAAAALAADFGPDHDLARAVLARGKTPKGEAVDAHAILLEYRDGLRGTALRLPTGGGTRWQFACQLKGEEKPRATSYYVGPWDNRNLFKALSHAIQTHFRAGRAPYPVERTLLTTGVLDAAMDSRVAAGKPIETPQLAISYQPRDFRAMREMGATWKIITEGTPQPPGIEPAPTKSSG